MARSFWRQRHPKRCLAVSISDYTELLLSLMKKGVVEYVVYPVVSAEHTQQLLEMIEQ